MSRRSGRKYATETTTFPEEEELEDLEEDSLEEGEEITRCVCGFDEIQTSSIPKEFEDLLYKEYKVKIDNGLFIQCDKCGVWQHGYCVGLFDNNDVPEKYWCELCKPEVHIMIHESKRTLYKPVNDKRKKIEQSITKKKGSSNSSTRNSPPTGKRKRHHHEEDEYDYELALQKAIRESAKESGVPVDTESDNKQIEEQSRPKRSGRGNTNPLSEPEPEEVHKEEVKNPKIELEGATDSELNDTSNIDEESHENSDISTKRRGGRISKKKKKKEPPVSSSSNSSSSTSSSTTLSKEELINQPSKPRFVSQKSSIYELRKRTGAILEWLNRSTIELQDEKFQKLQLFKFISNNDDNTQQVEIKFNENLQLMENLTQQILIWEQKFGKYAP